MMCLRSAGKIKWPPGPVAASLWTLLLCRAVIMGTAAAETGTLNMFLPLTSRL